MSQLLLDAVLTLQLLVMDIMGSACCGWVKLSHDMLKDATANVRQSSFQLPFSIHNQWIQLKLRKLSRHLPKW